MDSIVNLAVEKIGKLLVKEAKFLDGVKDEVGELQEELNMMNSFLIDMEALDDELGDERLRSTAKQIMRIAYDAEDVIESYILKVVNPAQKKNDFFKRYLRFCECLVNTHKAGSEIEAINTRIARTMDLLRRYRGENGLTKVAREGMSNAMVWRPASYSRNKEDHVVGLDEDINRLVGWLTTNKTQIQVLSVAGMPGSGKTTLVRKLFNHESVKNWFDSMAWVPISRKWVAQYGLIDIFKRIKQSDEAPGHQAIGEKIHEYLETRRFLIVLDDVWTKQALEDILPAFPIGNKGSKIIVTTRFREVVDYPTLKTSIHEPRELTAEESWELFRKIALNNVEESISSIECAELEALGKEMLKKCKGLPLAIVALAGLLAKKETLEEWEKVKMAMSSMVMETGRGTETYGAVKEALSLSYNDLPRNLKPCFLYLGLFPEDSEIPTGMLIRMWMAEGFISSTSLHQGEEPEDLARKYLDELIGRCVVRVASRNYHGKAKTIEVHDLMRDLCINKAKEIDFLETLAARSSNLFTTLRATQPRRTVVHSYNDKVFCTFPTNNQHLRSLFLFARPNVGDLTHVYPDEIAQLSSFRPILNNFKLLRVLSLIAIEISGGGTLPEEIGSLIHLRYLGLRVTNIPELPSSIGNLRNLLTLDDRGVCFSHARVKIPNVLWQIEGIRHVYLPGNPLEDMRFDTLQQLQILWVGGGSWMLDQLPKLSTSVRKLHINAIENSEQLEVAFQCPSIMSDRLHSLKLSWLGARGGEGEDEGEGEVEGEGEGESEGEGVSDGENDMALKNVEHIVNSRHLRKLTLIGRIDDISACFKLPISIKRLHLEYTKLKAEATLETLGDFPT